MKVRHIIFTGDRIPALLRKEKSQTRRLVKDQPPPCKGFPRIANGEWGIYLDAPHRGPYKHIGPCPYGEPGDLLYVKEGFAPIGSVRPSGYWDDPKWEGRDCWYRASDDLPMWGGKWCSPIHMPRRYSRITLELTGVRVEQVCQICHEDALAEGCKGYNWVASSPYIIGPHTDDGELPVEQFERDWIDLHGPNSWDKWVWALSFKVHLANVDTMLATLAGAAT